MNMQKIIFGNWKMNLSDEGAVALAKSITTVRIDASFVRIGVLPSFTALAAVGETLRGSAVALGAQDCFWETAGAYTGEISPTQLKKLGCTHVLIGHSERRQYLGETDDMINRKVRAALAADLTPVLCIGETDDARRRGLWSNVIADQTTKGLSGIELIGTQSIIVAYEPIWAVGTGRACAPEDAREAHALVMNALIEQFGPSVAKNNFRIIYGGSVDAKNIGSYLGEEGIDGALVGGASQHSPSFVELIVAAQK
jgi:triosephosphate isomerase